MKSVTLAAQIEAVDVVIRLLKPGSRKLKPGEVEILTERLQAVIDTLNRDVARIASFNVEPQPFLDER